MTVYVMMCGKRSTDIDFRVTGANNTNYITSSRKFLKVVLRYISYFMFATTCFMDQDS
jgi:hypothetical protein